LKRLTSERSVPTGGAAGTNWGYTTGARRNPKQTTGGIQLVAFLVRRWRFASVDAAVRTVFTEWEDDANGEQ